nr:hypothetical protein GCM10020185_03910 [Pseudomonas brassicacearum subsp. brassicacearum]
MFFQQPLQHLHHAEPMENPAPRTLLQLLEVGDQRQAIADAPRRQGTQADAVDNPMDARFAVKAQESRMPQDQLRIYRRGQADQFEVKAVWLVEGFAAIEPQDLQLQVALRERQAEGTFRVVAHRSSYWREERRRGYETAGETVLVSRYFRNALQHAVKNVDPAG